MNGLNARSLRQIERTVGVPVVRGCASSWAHIRTFETSDGRRGWWRKGTRTRPPTWGWSPPEAELERARRLLAEPARYALRLVDPLS